MNSDDRQVTYWLRPSTASDLEFVFQLNKRNMRPYVEELRGWNEAAERLDMSHRFLPGHDQIIVADGEDAGIFAVDWSDSLVHLRHLEILPEFQAKGIGTSLVTELLLQAELLNVPVVLRVLKSNRACHLYERLGFRVIRSDDTKHLMATRCRSNDPRLM